MENYSRWVQMGTGDLRQLGLGENITERRRAAVIKDLEGLHFVFITCGEMHSAVVSEMGDTFIWGSNDDFR